MLALKHGVSLSGLTPQIVLAVIAAHALYEQYGADLILTSVSDGKHSETSLHYSGNAVDLRTRNVSAETAKKIADELRVCLGRHFDVCLESDHLHVEYQPRYSS